MSSSRPTVFIVDDDPRVLKSLTRLLRSADLGPVPFSSPEEFLVQHAATRDCCVVLDLAMPGLNGLQLQEAITARDETLPIIFLSGHANIPAAVDALRRGAVNFLTKPVDDQTLLAAIHEALEKSRVAWQAKLEREDLQARLGLLTNREREVMDEIILGKLNKQIAGDLAISEKTVKVHRARVMRKMDLMSVAELVRLVGRTENRPPSVSENQSG